MAAVAKAVLLGCALVAALVAVVFGLRRARAPVDPNRRGFLGSIKGAFYAAVGVVLGTSASCGEGHDEPEPSCYVPAYDGGDRASGDDAESASDDADASCYEASGVDVYSPDEAGDVDVGTTEVDDAGQTDDADVTADDADWACYADPGPEESWSPDDAVPDVEPDVEAVDPDAEPESGAEAADGEDPDALIGLAPADRRRRLKWARRTLERAKAVRRLVSEPRTDPAVREALRADLGTLRRHVRLARRWLGIG